MDKVAFGMAAGVLGNLDAIASAGALYCILSRRTRRAPPPAGSPAASSTSRGDRDELRRRVRARHADRAAYRQQAEEAATLFKELGATAVVEAWGEDVPEGKVNPFHTAVMRKEDQAVVFSGVLWPNEATREAGWKKMQETMPMPATMPLDGTRMIYGGFEPIVER